MPAHEANCPHPAQLAHAGTGLSWHGVYNGQQSGLGRDFRPVPNSLLGFLVAPSLSSGPLHGWTLVNGGGEGGSG